MCALPDKKREPLLAEFFSHFEELQNDMLNLRQLLKSWESTGIAFDVIQRELEALKEDALDRLYTMEDLYHENPSIFPQATKQILHQCHRLIEKIDSHNLHQKGWTFNENWLNDFRRSFWSSH